MSEFTTKERKVINDAWDYVIHIADESTHFKWDLRRALKHERKERKSTTIGKAIILSAIEDQLRKPSHYRIYDLAYLCEGAICAHIVASEWQRLAKSNGPYDKSAARYREFLKKLLPMLTYAREANQQSTNRMLYKVRS
jgi:hypothetical protein